LSCDDWTIPAPPNGEKFDAGKTNVRLAVDGATETLRKAPAAPSCGNLEGWYYDNAAAPRKVVACPATCSRIQAASEAKVDLLFGCATVLLL
jgi:hypothetical protein